MPHRSELRAGRMGDDLFDRGVSATSGQGLVMPAATPEPDHIGLAQTAQLKKQLGAIAGGSVANALIEAGGIPDALEAAVRHSPQEAIEALSRLARTTALLQLSRCPTLMIALLQEFYPTEISNLMAAGRPTPEGQASDSTKYSTVLAGLVSESVFQGRALQYPELDRALVGVVSTIQLLQGDWDLLRACQDSLPGPIRLSDESCREMQSFIVEAIQSDVTRLHGLIAVGLLMDLDLKFILNNDAGKMSAIADSVRETLQRKNLAESLDTVEHDRVLHLALEHCPERFPSITKGIDPELRARLTDAVSIFLNPLQLNQGENIPGSIDPKIFKVSREALLLKCVESLGDLMGVQGHQVQNGTMMIEPVAKGVMSTFKLIIEAIDTPVSSTLNPEQALKLRQKKLYDSVLSAKNEMYGWGFDISRQEEWVLARLCCLGRVENGEQAAVVRRVLHELPDGDRGVIINEMSKSGLDGLGCWLEYLPATIANSVTFYSRAKELPKLEALQEAFRQVLPACANAHRAVKDVLSQEEHAAAGEYILNIEPLARIARLFPGSLADCPFTIERRRDGAELIIPPSMLTVFKIAEMVKISDPDDLRALRNRFDQLHPNLQAILVQELGRDEKQSLALTIQGASKLFSAAMRHYANEPRDLAIDKTSAHMLPAFVRILQLGMEKTKRIHTQPGAFAIDLTPVLPLVIDDPAALDTHHLAISNNRQVVAEKVASIDLSAFNNSLLTSHRELPGKRLALIGMGGGSDIIQAGIVANLVQRESDKGVSCLISIRREGESGQADTIQNARHIRSGVVQILPDSVAGRFGSSGRFPEPIFSRQFPTYLVIDRQDGSLADLISAAIADADREQGTEEDRTDTIITLDTGGDALMDESTEDTVGRTTPDQDIVALKACENLNFAHVLSCVVAPGIDSPPDVAERLQRAEALCYRPSPQSRTKILQDYDAHDFTGGNPNNFGSTAFCFQAALSNSGTHGHTPIPLPTTTVTSRDNPWHTIKWIEPAMGCIFYMELRKHLQIIRGQ